MSTTGVHRFFSSAFICVPVFAVPSVQNKKGYTYNKLMHIKKKKCFCVFVSILLSLLNLLLPTGIRSRSAFLARLCVTAQQSYSRYVGVRRSWKPFSQKPSSELRPSFWKNYLSTISHFSSAWLCQQSLMPWRGRLSNAFSQKPSRELMPNFVQR